jgi:hypothetical protein
MPLHVADRSRIRSRSFSAPADKVVKINLLMPLPVQPRSQGNAWQALEAGTRSVMKADKQSPQLRKQRTRVGHRAMSQTCHQRTSTAYYASLLTILRSLGFCPRGQEPS